MVDWYTTAKFVHVMLVVFVVQSLYPTFID